MNAPPLAALPVAAIAVALLLDRWAGEPPDRWHPVAWMGRLLAWPQAWLERQAPWPGFVLGSACWALAASAATLLGWAVETALWRLLVPHSDALRWFIAALLLGMLLKPLFAWRMLRDEVHAVETALQRDGLAAGRTQLARLVSRPTATLDEALLRESAIESLAENLNDSVIAPLFWFAVGGLPGAALYRFANTADAMWGYRDRREWMGKTVARADDLLSWLPARLTAAALLPAPGRWATLRRQARRTPSPNSGWPMAAIALQLGLRLRKPQVYQLNDAGRVLAAGDVERAIAQGGRALLIAVPLLMAAAALLPWEGIELTARCVMVLGTTSHAGKSWLATALCRWYARRGLKVAPYKAQNMSNNARVVAAPDGTVGEIGSAQYFQALAARRVPDLRMNPVLLKPERDTASQVIVLGRVRADLAAVPWHERSARLAPLALDALQSLRAENDLLVIEGAGSPAEINLQHSDYVNLGTARASQAACLLVADIDRGGAFAHLYGTHRMLPPDVRGQVRGFVLNRFRGDPTLLAPAPAQLQAMTGVPTIGVLPLWREHGLPEEDGVLEERAAPAVAPRTRIALIAYPRISNLDEFQPLRQLPGLQLDWVRTPQQLSDADCIVLPGSKHTSADLAWLHAQGLVEPIRAHAARGGRVLGICGGLQMLGEALHDPHGVDGAGEGLGLLPLRTEFALDKLVRHTAARFDALPAPWDALGRSAVTGYEIRHGRTTPTGGTGHTTPTGGTGRAATVALRNDSGEAIGWQAGAVLGIYLHGLFENPALLRALFSQSVRPLDSVFDGLADFLDTHLDARALMALLDR